MSSTPRPSLAESLRGDPGGGDSRAGTVRRIALAGEEVDYCLVRARGRSIVMQIGLSGLAVRAPRWATVRDIETALQDRAAWIVRTLAAWRGRRREVLPRQWRSGAAILYQGSQLALAVHPARSKTVLADMFHVTVLHPSPDDERLVAALVLRWLKEEALRLLVPRLARYAARVGPTMPPLKLSNARGEWGSCNHKGEIRLNWRLVHLPPGLADYVVAHEVAHLVELNHSKRFWTQVETLYPGHSDARRALGDWTALLET